MLIEMKCRDDGHKDECWKMDLREKAVLIGPDGNVVVELEPAEALCRFRIPSFGGDTHYFEMRMGDDLLAFSVRKSDLRQIEHFLNWAAAVQRRTVLELPPGSATASLGPQSGEGAVPGQGRIEGTHAEATMRGMRNPTKAVLASLLVFAGLGGFALWRSMGSGASPAQALAKIEQAPTSQPRTQDQLPRTPAIKDEPVPASHPQVQPRRQDQLLQTSAISAVLVQREEAMAIEGLRACALFTGRYPESLAVIDGHLNGIIQQLRENPTSKAQSTGLDAGPARTRDEKIVCICRLMSFYTFLRGNRREPVYYGKVVKPGEADRVLLRWRQGPNEYRVVFGDLQAETVTADRLAQLEATLPW